MTTLLDGWYTDRSPGRRTTGRSGIVGSGVTSFSPPPPPPTPPTLPTLPPAGDVIPLGGALSPNGFTRNQIFMFARFATGFQGFTLLTDPAHNFDVPTTGGSNYLFSMSAWVNFGITNTAGFVPKADQGCFFSTILATSAYMNCLQFAPSILDGNPSGPASIANLPAPPFPGGYVQSTIHMDGSTYGGYPSDTGVNGGWVHLMVGMKLVPGGGHLGTLTRVLYVNDTQIMNETQTDTVNYSPTQWFNSTADYTDTNGLHAAGFGGRFFTQREIFEDNLNSTLLPNGIPDGDGLYCGAAEWWMDNSHYIDWTNSTNRAKFHISDAAGLNFAPCSLGATGNTPFGYAPAAYLRGDPDNFQINQANGDTLAYWGHKPIPIDEPIG